MTKSRIAIFEGYAAPFGRVALGRGRPAAVPVSSYGGRLSNLGRPTNGRSSSPGRRFTDDRPPPTVLGAMGRRAYYVPERNESITESRVPYRKGYRVPAKRDTPAMKRAQKRFKTCARKCAKKRGARKNFPTCMRKCVSSKKRRSR